MRALELPEEFWIVLEDDALAPRAPVGSKVKFSTSEQPALGDAVLLQDGHGRLHARVYCERLANGGEGVSLRPPQAARVAAYPGVRVVAVLTAVEARWSADEASWPA